MTNEIKNLIEKFENIPFVSKHTISNELTKKFENEFIGTPREIAIAKEKLKQDINNKCKEEMIKHNKERADIEELIKKAVYNEYSVSEKIGDIIWNRAYEKGHSNGLYSVIDEFNDLVDFANDIKNA